MIHGAQGTFNVWNPVVNPLGQSISQLWIIAGDSTNLNTIEVGWRVNPVKAKSQPRFFIYWTRDNYQSTGCFDLVCPGLVQTNKDFIVGAYIDKSSVYDGLQMGIYLDVHRDPTSGHWWLSFNNVAIGYWPSSLFTTMANNGGDVLSWGGEVFDIQQDNNTITQMGSGHFSSEGFKKSSFVRDMSYIDNNNNKVLPTQQDLELITSAPSCYDCRLDVLNSDLRLFFGGPGCKAQAP